MITYVLPLKIKLSRVECWNPFSGLAPVTFWCLSQAKTWISNAICRGLSLCSVSYGGLEMIVRFVDIDGIGDLSLLKFLFIILVYK